MFDGDLTSWDGSDPYTKTDVIDFGVVAEKVRLNVISTHGSSDAVLSEVRFYSSEGPSVAFRSSNSGAFETETPAVLDVALRFEEGETYTVDYAVTGGTAAGGDDYILAPGTLIFNPDESNQTISIDIIDDGLDEEDETIVVSLSNPTSTGSEIVLREPSKHTYTIRDTRPQVSFAMNSSSGREDAGPAEVTVGLSFASDKIITVDYEVIGGTATGGGVDYTLEAGTLTFEAEQTSQTVSIELVQDAESEDEETIMIALSNPANAKLGSITEYTHTIVDAGAFHHLKVDLGLPACGSSWDNVIPVDGTVKEGWWGRVFWGDTDMYMHDFAWEDGWRGIDPPDTAGVDGTGVHFAIDTARPGNGGYHVHGMCRADLGGEGCPSGSAVGEPIANGWFHNIDWGGECRGDIHMRITGLPPGEYKMISYHNHWEPCSQSSRNCLDCFSQMPPMPIVYARSLPAPGQMECGGSWSGTGEGVQSVTEAYNIKVTSVLTDADVATSTIEFRTNGSDVLVVYDGGDNSYPDPARPGREGSKGILNAFELMSVGAPPPPVCLCPGNLNDDDQIDLEDLQAVAGILLQAGSPFIVEVGAGHCGNMNDDLQIDLEDLQAVAGILLQAGSPFVVPCE